MIAFDQESLTVFGKVKRVEPIIGLLCKLVVMKNVSCVLMALRLEVKER